MATLAKPAPRVVRDRAKKMISVLPGKDDATASVILTHGLGDSAEGFADVAMMWAEHLPHVNFILPTAPNQPVTLNGGYVMPSWYDIEGLPDRSSEKCKGIEESASTIMEIMDSEHASGIPYNRMVLAGFSQGGALSLWTGMQLPVEKKLGGILVMSGYLAGAQRFSLTSGLEDTPILHCHGTSDPMVKWEWAEMSKAHVTELGASAYTLLPFPGMAHSVNEEELGKALHFINGMLPNDVHSTDKPIGDMNMKELKAAIAKAGLGKQAVGLLEKSEYVALLKQASGSSSAEKCSDQ